MAKQPADREDLLREGTAMPVRGRLRIDSTEVVIGFRARGQLSLYWDQDPVFQFDEECRLRRVFIDSNRFKAENGRLVRLVKLHDAGNPTVERLRLGTEAIPPRDESLILQRLTDCLQQIERSLGESSVACNDLSLQAVGAEPDVFLQRVRQWVARLSFPIGVSDQPSA